MIMVGCETHFFFAKMENELKSIIEEYFSSSEYKIIELVFRGEKGTKVAEVYVDKEDGININELAAINRELNDLVDTKLIVKDLSKLVVSSPGAERSFRYLWQLKKHTGRILEIELHSGEKTEGRLISVEDSGSGLILLEIIIKEKGKKNTPETRAINFSDIKESRVKISFSK